MHKFVAVFVNVYVKILGDKKPDFYNASRQFTTEFCEIFNTKSIDDKDIYYQSYCSVMKNSFSDMLMCHPHLMVNLIEGDNDGLVTPSSATWEDFKGVISGKTRRGIAHADIVDFIRLNYSKIDIRDIYI